MFIATFCKIFRIIFLKDLYQSFSIFSNTSHIYYIKPNFHDFSTQRQFHNVLDLAGMNLMRILLFGYNILKAIRFESQKI